MATLLGINALKQYAIPTYWDAGLLKNIELEVGYTYEQFISDVAAGLAIVNGGLLSDPLYGGLISLTDEVAMEYPIGVTGGFEDATEYGRPEAIRAATTGHMLPLKEYDRALAWTFQFLKKARRIQLDADIAAAMADLQNKYEQLILTRLYKNTYDAVGSGRSMPLADGGTADSTYIPPHLPDREETAFDATHDHVEDLNGITQANLEAAVAHIWHHGHNAPFTLQIALADLADWQNTSNVTGFVKKPDVGIRYGTTVDLAQVPDEFVGIVETKYGSCRMWATGRVPTGYWALYKTYGALDQRNPLVVRYNPMFGIGATLLAGDHIRIYPLENALLWMEMGVGVMDRIGAIVVQNTAGSYAAPTIA